MMEVVERWTRERSVADCVAALEAAGVPCSAYGDPGDALADPHLVERGLFGRITDAAGAFTGVNPPWRMSGTAAELRGRVPATGGDRDAVLAEWLAADAAEIERWRAAGVFGGAAPLRPAASRRATAPALPLQAGFGRAGMLRPRTTAGRSRKAARTRCDVARSRRCRPGRRRRRT